MLDRMWLAFSVALFVALMVFVVMYFKKRMFIIETAFKDQAEIVQNILGMFNTMIGPPSDGEKPDARFAPEARLAPEAPTFPMSVLGGGLSGIGDILGMMGDTGAETMMFFNGGLNHGPHAEYARDARRAHADGTRSMVVEDITDASAAEGVEDITDASAAEEVEVTEIGAEPVAVAEVQAEAIAVAEVETEAVAVTDVEAEAEAAEAAEPKSKDDSVYRAMKIDELRQIAAASSIQCKSKSKKDIIAALLERE